MYTADRPLSYREILEHTQTWTHGLVGNQLANMLAKSKNFVRVGSVDSGRYYDIGLWSLSDSVEKIDIKKSNMCIVCDAYLKNIQKSRCGKCYLEWKKKERAKRGEA